ncbi:MAG: helix-turn-helix transcriptional regulator [Clostridia bacterium]|nr:helix-turn-helix transcriptional regulator [Clostridia bacterium]
MSGINRYYEDLVFASGTKINVSRRINSDFFDTVHWHPYVEVLVSRCDGNSAAINFASYRLDRNDIALIWSGDLHAVHTVREDSCLIIQFPIALLAVMGELNGILSRLSRLHCVRYDEQNPESLRILQCAGDIDRHHFQGGPFREVLVYADLLNLFALIGSQCIHTEAEAAEAGDTAGQANLKLMTEACLYISENCMKPLSLSDVALKIGVSRSHFAHLFKSYTNMTFVDFLTVERIKLAETFFMNPNLRITDIAFESGFSSISSFNRSFRKVKGCSPTEFRATMID